MITFKNKPDTTTPINAENLNSNFNELSDKLKNSKITFNIITNLQLKAKDTYQLTLPAKTLFIEPLIKSGGSNYSGGQFIVPGGVFSYITSTDVDSSYRGIWINCSNSGLVTISDYKHCGSVVSGFRIWYLNE